MNQPAELYACLYAKEFPAQALLRLRPELHSKPCVVMKGEPPLQQVCSLNTKARLLGMTHGMTRVEVDTFPALVLLSRSHKEEMAVKATGVPSVRALVQAEGNRSVASLEAATIRSG